jgi:SpoVK/Ycf46/Vps4 family AAA+-type ATPase
MEEQGEEMQDALKLVHVLAPEDVVQKMGEIVLTEDQKAEINKIIKAIEYRDYLRDIGLRDIGKILFIGLPGTGKTSTARAMSEKLKLPFIEVRLSMVISQYLGETSKNIDKVFELGKELAPCILFIDEFDFVAKTRTSDEHAAIKRAVNTLLKNIDEISLVNDAVLLIAATNHPQLLDTAAWRRFDEILMFPMPDVRMRREILALVMAKIPGKFDFGALAKASDGLSGSDIRLIVREAVLTALTHDRKKLTQEEMLTAAKDFSRRLKARTLENV